MIRLVFLFLFILLSGSRTFGQRSLSTTKIKWINAELQSLVTPSCGRFISFTSENGTDIEVKPDSISQRLKDLHSIVFDLNYLGHRALLEELCGKPFPEKAVQEKLKSLIKKHCDINSFQGKIYQDSVIITVTRNCPTNEDDRIFTRIERKISYPGGQPAFQQYLQSSISSSMNSIPSKKTDSSIYFMIVIKKDSMIHDIKLLQPSHPSAFTDLMTQALLKTRQWTPANVGGINVSMYESVYIHLKSDGTIEADYKRSY
jgi:hypothetical protein